MHGCMVAAHMDNKELGASERSNIDCAHIVYGDDKDGPFAPGVNNCAALMHSQLVGFVEHVEPGVLSVAADAMVA